MYQLTKRSKFSGILAGRCGSVVLRERVVSLASVFSVVTRGAAARETRERVKDMKGTRSTLRCDLLSF